MAASLLTPQPSLPPRPTPPCPLLPPRAGFPTRKPFMQFAQRYALLLGKRRLQELSLPLTPTGFVDWYSVTDEQVGGWVGGG